MTSPSVVVIGSGYGGSVAALRFAEAGYEVSVLERGKRHHAGVFPRGEDAHWVPEKNQSGPHQFRRLNQSLTGWVAAGVGGGSLINASVMLRKDNFDDFPGITRAELDPYYDIVERMLDVQPYPETPEYARTPKTDFMASAAKKLGAKLVRPNLAISFKTEPEPDGAPHQNRFGATQQKCRKCGECSLPGCNYSAKNTLDLNYLRQAETLGAKILPQREVDRIEPVENGYVVWWFDPLDRNINGTIRANQVVLAAGSLGSTEILLKNRELYDTLPKLSKQLGKGFNTNGNFIGFATFTNPSTHPEIGPEITAGIGYLGPDGKRDGFYIFDGSYREPWKVLGGLVGLPTIATQLINIAIKTATKVGVFWPETTLPLLVLGRDDAVGRLKLSHKKLEVDIDLDENKAYYAEVEKAMSQICAKMGAKFLPFPLWRAAKQIDVPHPLAGCIMGDSQNTGVVDNCGRVFGYPGLFVLDGSIIPTSLGVNPALTIAAIAERAMDKILLKTRPNVY